MATSSAFDSNKRKTSSYGCSKELPMPSVFRKQQASQHSFIKLEPGLTEFDNYLDIVKSNTGSRISGTGNTLQTGNNLIREQTKSQQETIEEETIYPNQTRQQTIFDDLKAKRRVRNKSKTFPEPHQSKANAFKRLRKEQTTALICTNSRYWDCSNMFPGERPPLPQMTSSSNDDPDKLSMQQIFRFLNVTDNEVTRQKENTEKRIQILQSSLGKRAKSFSVVEMALTNARRHRLVEKIEKNAKSNSNNKLTKASLLLPLCDSSPPIKRTPVEGSIKNHSVTYDLRVRQRLIKELSSLKQKRINESTEAKIINIGDCYLNSKSMPFSNADQRPSKSCPPYLSDEKNPRDSKQSEKSEPPKAKVKAITSEKANDKEPKVDTNKQRTSGKRSKKETQKSKMADTSGLIIKQSPLTRLSKSQPTLGPYGQRTSYNNYGLPLKSSTTSSESHKFETAKGLRPTGFDKYLNREITFSPDMKRFEASINSVHVANIPDPYRNTPAEFLRIRTPSRVNPFSQTTRRVHITIPSVNDTD